MILTMKTVEGYMKFFEEQDRKREQERQAKIQKLMETLESETDYTLEELSKDFDCREIVLQEIERRRVEKEKEYSFKREVLHVDEIVKLINLIGQTSDIKKMHVDRIAFDGKEYSFDLNEAKLVIGCSDGRKVVFESFTSSSNEMDGYYRTWVSESTRFGLVFMNPNQKAIYFGGRCYSGNNYLSNVTSENLIKRIENCVYFFDKFDETGLISNYLDYECAAFGIKLSWYLRPTCVTVARNGDIHFGNFVLSQDGSMVIFSYQEKLSDYDEIHAKVLRLEDDAEKTSKFINGSEFDEVTLEAFKNAVNSIEKAIKEYQKKMDYHRDVPKRVQKYLDIQKEAIEIYQSFTKEELGYLAVVFEQEIKKQKQLIEEQKVLENSSEERIETLVRSLKPTEIEALRKRINN